MREENKLNNRFRNKYISQAVANAKGGVKAVPHPSTDYLMKDHLTTSNGEQR
jgi:hypothetical protein